MKDNMFKTAGKPQVHQAAYICGMEGSVPESTSNISNLEVRRLEEEKKASVDKW